MIDLQKFFLDFDNLIERLEGRGIKKEQLLIIKDNVINHKEVQKNINNDRRIRNQLSKEGSKNAEKVVEIKKVLRVEEKKLVDLSQKIYQ